MATKLFTVKTDESLLERFHKACAGNDQTASQEVRKFMREYVRKYGQADLFDTPKQSKGGRK